MIDSNNIDINMIDFLDLINFTLSSEFIEKWRFKYSEKFIKYFQFKIMESMMESRPLKSTTLFNYLTRRCKYSQTQVNNFFTSIDIELYYPAIIQ